MIGATSRGSGLSDARRDALLLRPVMRTDTVRVALFGGAGVGKSALAVRLLTRRFIGDYTSEHDLYYKHQFLVGESTQIKVEILDASASRQMGVCCRGSPPQPPHAAAAAAAAGASAAAGAVGAGASQASFVVGGGGGGADLLEERVAWCGAAVVVYSIDDRSSFERARDIVARVRRERPRLPCLLLANKRDLEHARAVPRCDGCELMLSSLPCQFAEVSAADDYDLLVGLFVGLARDALAYVSSGNGRKSPQPKRRKSIVHVAKALGTVFSTKALHRPQRPPSPTI